ncbi:MAG: aminoglycoside 6'-N-acetyltransferase [Gemmatirosa sp.]
MTSTATQIRAYRAVDHAEWLRMRRALWPDDTLDAAMAGMAAWLARSDTEVLVAERAGGAGLAGFAEVGTRSHADGCLTSPVAYLEGWYVDADVRRQGVGAALVHAAESWARGKGIREFASDTPLDNDVSQQAHRALGFEEVDRVVEFRKPLD